MRADSPARPVLRAGALHADIGRPGNLDHRPQVQAALAEAGLEQFSRPFESGWQPLAGNRLPLFEGFPAGQSPHPVFRDLHATRTQRFAICLRKSGMNSPSINWKADSSPCSR